MKSSKMLAIFLPVLVNLVQSLDIPVDPMSIPDPKEKFFEFHLSVDHRYTMMDHSKPRYLRAPAEAPTILYYNSKTQEFTSRSTSFNEPCNTFQHVNTSYILKSLKNKQLIFGEGNHRRVISINGQRPGPTLVVNQGSEVVVTVQNDLMAEGITVHFHGLHQRGQWWMDGVQGIQQCPITPGSSFVYRFQADEAGTYWYHGHNFLDRSEGLFGALIVIPKKEFKNAPKQNQFVKLQSGKIVATEAQHVLQVEEWFSKSVTETYFKVKPWALKLYNNLDEPEDTDHCFLPTRNSDGSGSSPAPISSVLINGIGRTDYQQLEKSPLDVPIQVYTVKKDAAYLFRIINVGLQVGLRISIDKHKLHVVASDGFPIESCAADFLVIFPGERYDIAVITDQKPGSYFIKVETLETTHYYKNATLPFKHFCLVKLQYENVQPANNAVPDFSESQCTKYRPCTVLGCPWLAYSSSHPYKCIHMSVLRSFELEPSVSKNEILSKSTTKNWNFEEHMIKLISFDGVNSRHFKYPIAPPYQYTDNEETVMKPCDLERCKVLKDCICTYHLNLTANNIVQLTFIGGNGGIHPIHIHGHHFAVLKQGWGKYDESSGFRTTGNDDVKCPEEGEPCFQPEWKDKSWYNGNVPGLNFDRPILKDTIVVPEGGYSVVRFKADNPGWWVLHCHVALHHAVGMALGIREGSHKEMPLPPADMPSCGPYDVKNPHSGGICQRKVGNTNYFWKFILKYLQTLGFC